jgi:hypothetical protein
VNFALAVNSGHDPESFLWGVFAGVRELDSDPATRLFIVRETRTVFGAVLEETCGSDHEGMSGGTMR